MVNKMREELVVHIPPEIESIASAAELLSVPVQASVPETRYDLRILEALRQVIRAVDLHSRQLFRHDKITGPQLLTLLTIEKYEPVTVSAIAGYIHLSSSTVIGILDRLDAKRLIHRDRDQHDRRLVKVSLTEEGKELARNAPSPLQNTLVEAMGNLPEPELEIMAESLERLAQLMRTQHADATPILESMAARPDLENANV
jgi:DNA-binding MarR family transcriptional regulator